MIRRVVVPLDGSAPASAALGPARALAEVTDATLRLVTATGTSVRDRLDDAGAYLKQQVAELGLERVETEVVEDQGASAAILGEGRTEDTVVCMATHGRSGLGQLALGSVVEAVLRGSESPMLLVGPSLARGAWQFAHWFANAEMLVTVDGSEASEAIVPVAAEWAGLLGLRAWVVQVLPAAVGIAFEPHELTDESLSVRQVAERLGHGAQWDVLHGPDAADALHDYAEQLPATLVAMATHGRTGLARVALGSTAMRVVHRSTCPVLVTRSADQTA